MHDIIVVGASAGGVEALITLIHQLPSTIPAAVFVVIHFPPQATSVLPRLLNRAGTLLAHHAANGEEIRHGHIYVAPPDWHLIVQNGYVEVTHGPHENRHRPAIDPLFRSAALHYGSRVIGILLSGMQDDGTAGLQIIKSAGGITICQDPTEATYSDMPRNAIEQVGVHHVLTIKKMAELLITLTAQETPIPFSDTPVPQTKQETKSTPVDSATMEVQEPSGIASTLECPTCGCGLWEVQEGERLHYICPVGHTFSPAERLASRESHIETALWSTLRALDERVNLLQGMAERAQGANRPHTDSHLQLQKKESEARATLLRKVLMTEGLALLTDSGSKLPNGKATQPTASITPNSEESSPSNE